jgi:hypothetical protein
LDANIANLVDLLLRAEAAVVAGDSAGATDSIVEFARLVFQTEPFRPSGTMPDYWENALREWIEGKSASKIVGLDSSKGVDLLQEAISYRLPWAMEAVRVHAIAVRQDGAEQIKGHAAMAAEVGNANLSVIKLLRAGLNSREAAITAVTKTEAAFIDYREMLEWLRSDQVESMSKMENWPTKQSRPAWLQFFSTKKGNRLKLTCQTQVVQVEWFIDAPPINTHVIVEPDARLVLTTDYVRLGVLITELSIQSHDIVNAWVADCPNTVVVEYFGPS